MSRLDDSNIQKLLAKAKQYGGLDLLVGSMSRDRMDADERVVEGPPAIYAHMEALCEKFLGDSRCVVALGVPDWDDGVNIRIDFPFFWASPLLKDDERIREYRAKSRRLNEQRFDFSSTNSVVGSALVFLSAPDAVQEGSDVADSPFSPRLLLAQAFADAEGLWIRFKGADVAKGWNISEVVPWSDDTVHHRGHWIRPIVIEDDGIVAAFAVDLGGTEDGALSAADQADFEANLSLLSDHLARYLHSEYLISHDRLLSSEASLQSPAWRSIGRVLSTHYIERFYKRAATHIRDGKHVMVIYCDGDGVRTLNLAFGHHVGNEFIRRVGRILHNGCCAARNRYASRPEPTAAGGQANASELKIEGATACRWGGDEFVVFLTLAIRQADEHSPETNDGLEGAYGLLATCFLEEVQRSFALATDDLAERLISSSSAKLARAQKMDFISYLGLSMGWAVHRGDTQLVDADGVKEIRKRAERAMKVCKAMRRVLAEVDQPGDRSEPPDDFRRSAQFKPPVGLLSENRGKGVVHTLNSLFVAGPNSRAPSEMGMITLGSGEPRVGITAAIHGDEPAGVMVLEALQKRLQDLPTLTGSVQLIRVAHPAALRVGTRKSPLDGLDLNRVGAGSVEGSATEVLAATLVKICEGAKLIVNLHEFEMRSPIVAVFYGKGDGEWRQQRLRQISMCNPGYIWHLDAESESPIAKAYEETIDNALNEQGIPNFTIELPPLESLTVRLVEEAVDGLINLLRGMGVLAGKFQATRPESPRVVRRLLCKAQSPGLFVSTACLGGEIQEGDPIGTITDLKDLTPIEVKAGVTGTLFQLRASGRVEEGTMIAAIAQESEVGMAWIREALQVTAGAAPASAAPYTLSEGM